LNVTLALCACCTLTQQSIALVLFFVSLFLSILFSLSYFFSFSTSQSGFPFFRSSNRLLPEIPFIFQPAISHKSQECLEIQHTLRLRKTKNPPFSLHPPLTLISSVAFTCTISCGLVDFFGYQNLIGSKLR
jgi:hypothetical protein